jgi:predicted P-loop ATPase
MQDLTQHEVDQVWGEAVAEYQSGFKLHLSDNMEREMEHVRTEYQSTDQAAEAIMEYLDVLLPVEWPKLSNLDRRFYIQAVLENANTELVGVNQRTKVTVKEIQSELFKHDLRDATDRRYAREATQIRDIMRNLDGWSYAPKLWVNGRSVSGFKKT